MISSLFLLRYLYIENIEYLYACIVSNYIEACQYGLCNIFAFFFSVMPTELLGSRSWELGWRK